MKKYKTIDAYLKDQNEAKAIVAINKIRALVKKSIPTAEEAISYNIPAFKVEGKAFLYVAGFKKHFGIYPPIRKDKKLIAALKENRNEIGNLKFDYKEKVSVTLLQKIIKTLAKERLANKKGK